MYENDPKKNNNNNIHKLVMLIFDIHKLVIKAYHIHKLPILTASNCNFESYFNFMKF